VLVDEGKCVEEITNCDNYNCDGVCLDCLHGYSLAADLNVCVPEIIDSCLTYNSKTECLGCDNGYTFASENICVPKIIHCETYDNKGACLTCQSG
jgi:hypothetical protein